jgi:hypothetical protein
LPLTQTDIEIPGTEILEPWQDFYCTDKAGNIYSIPLYILRFVLLLLRLRRGASGLGELQCAHGHNKYFATAPAHTLRALHGAHSTRR